ncbi:MAG: STAS domain-containing protein [bacterium]
MNGENVDYRIEERGKFKVVTISGDILRGHRDSKINRDISALTGAGYHFFIFDLENLTYLDSSGISVFIHCLCDVQENNGAVFLIVKDPTVREVIELVGLNRLIKVFNSFEELERHHDIN